MISQPDKHAQYEIFLSYSRKDNQPPPNAPQGTPDWIAAIRDWIIEDFRLNNAEPPNIFYDASEIKSADDWRQRIYEALRQSKILVVCLSPNYFLSEYCYLEWDGYVRRQAHHSVGTDSIASIYFVEVPGLDDADRAQMLRHWREAIEAWKKVNPSVDISAAFPDNPAKQHDFEDKLTLQFRSISRAQRIDICRWFPEGAAALQNGDVQKRMAGLGKSIRERIDRARRAASVLGHHSNIRTFNPHFTGRHEELIRLHEEAAGGRIGIVTAVHGFGGQGKTELAVAYAHSWAGCYPAGVWMLGAEGKKEMLPLIGELAYVPKFGYEPSEAERNDPEQLGRMVLNKLQECADAAREKDPSGGAAALLILDNASEPGLLSAGQLITLERADWLRVIITTRLVESPADDRFAVRFPVDSLNTKDALALLRDHQPAQCFASLEEEESAAEIVRELGGFTLAIEQVALYLRNYPEVTSTAYLTGLRKRGLPSTDRLTERVGDQMLHREKQIAAILETTLARLDTPTRTALAFAALLPPDFVPWPWLKALTCTRHPELKTREPDEPDPWLDVRRRLEDLRLLTLGDHPELTRLHRLISAHLRETLAELKEPANGDTSSLLQMFDALLAARTLALFANQESPDLWELDTLLEILPSKLADSKTDHDLAIRAVFLSDVVQSHRSLGQAKALLYPARDALQRDATSDPSNADWQRDLSVSQSKIGNVLRAQDDLAGATAAYRKSLAVFERLAASDPSNAGWQHDLSVSQEKIGGVLLAQGDLAGATEAYREALAVRERLSASDPSNASWQHGLSVSQEKIGDVLRAQGDLVGALTSYRKSFAAIEPLIISDPLNAVWQRQISVSYIKIGDVFLARAQDDLAGATAAYRKSLAVFEPLTIFDPLNAVWQRQISVSYIKIGDVFLARAQDDLAGATAAYRKSLAVFERLAASDPSNIGWQRDLSVSQGRIGAVLLARGDLAGAAMAFREALAVRERLASSDPSNAVWQFDLSVSQEKIGDVLLAQDDLAGATKAFHESLAVVERLSASDPSNADWQRGLFVSYVKMAQIAEQDKSQDALVWWQKAHAKVVEMKQRGILAPSDEWVLAALEDKIK